MSTVAPSSPHPSVHRFWHVAWHALVVVLGDLVVLGAAFVAYAAYQSAFRALVATVDGAAAPRSELGLAVLAVAGVTWWVLSRWPTALGTALWLAVPTAIALVTLGVWAYPTTLLAIGVGAGLVGVVDAALLLAGRPWEQVLSITWVAVLLLVMVLTGAQL